MRKLLQFFDNHILKIGVIITALFIVLYPKLPSIHITYTWVYIRLEDFFILALVLLWFVQVIRRKVKIALPLGIPILIYWLVGLASLIYAVVLIGPHLIGFFPKIAALEYARRIEYMILFFVGFSAIRTRRDLKQFVIFLLLGIGAIIAYGFGQHFYPYFWKYLPDFIQKTNFCFPSFQTGNEEFAKGIPLCLPVGSRVTSTFGGHYDLAGYLIIVLPIVLGFFLFVKSKLKKTLLGMIFLSGVIMLILTSSRSAFLAYLVAAVVPLIFLKRKKFILPVLFVSIACLILFSESTIHRFVQTFRITSVVVNMQGQVVGITENGLSQDVQNQLKKQNKAIQPNQVIQGAVPEGSSFITLPQKKVATSTAVVQQSISGKNAQELNLANGGLELSTVQGNFSVQKALVYDISVTTRLQGEWPRAITAFLKYPLLGQGYSTLTLAVDNDFLRLLGESGILGFVSFFAIFVIFGIFLSQLLPSVDDPLVLTFVYGLVGGVIGLFVNATLFDIFEASKVAESLWLLLGIGASAVTLYQKRPIQYIKPLWNIITSKAFLYAYFFILTFGVFWSSISNFFVGDDFVWLKWAATSTFQDIPHYFTDAGGFFYRPLDKLLMLLFYSIFSFQPEGYHVMILLLHFFMAIAVYTLLQLLMKKKLWAFVGALLFILLPIHMENVLWISSLSIDMSAVFMLFAVIVFLKSSLSSSWKSVSHFVFSILLAVLALLSYELALVLPLLLFITDIFIARKISFKRLFLYVPFILLDACYMGMRLVTHAFTMGGDYAYSLPHLIPNIFGNSLGYVGLFIFGSWSLPFYEAFRFHAKQFSLPIALLLVVAVVVFVFLIRKKKWKKFVSKQSLPFYAICFSFLALLPYLGLGNIAQRYGYLSSVGFVLFVVWMGEMVFKKIAKKELRYFIAILLSAAILLGCNWVLMKDFSEWNLASRISFNTLALFKVKYPELSSQNTVVIVDRPILYGNAWIFPTGLPEGMWFIYGDEMPNVIDVHSLQDARQIAKSTPYTYVFTFQDKYVIQRAF